MSATICGISVLYVKGSNALGSLTLISESINVGNGTLIAYINGMSRLYCIKMLFSHRKQPHILSSFVCTAQIEFIETKKNIIILVVCSVQNSFQQ